MEIANSVDDCDIRCLFNKLVLGSRSLPGVLLRVGAAGVGRSVHKTLPLKGKTGMEQIYKPDDFRHGSPPLLFLGRE